LLKRSTTQSAVKDKLANWHVVKVYFGYCHVIASDRTQQKNQNTGKRSDTSFAFMLYISHRKCCVAGTTVALGEVPQKNR